MPTINVKAETYKKLLQVMAVELKKKIDEAESPEALIGMARNKFGITFSFIIDKLIKQYKSKSI